jgi:hypothetical protein
MRVFLGVGLAALLTQGALAESSYICVPDEAVGFTYDRASHKWNDTRFNVADKKYVVSHGLRGWEWYEAGSSMPLAVSCVSNSAGFINCGGHEDIQLNTKSLRYQIVDSIGYTANPSSRFPEGWRTPRIEIGTCAINTKR